VFQFAVVRTQQETKPAKKGLYALETPTCSTCGASRPSLPTRRSVRAITPATAAASRREGAPWTSTWPSPTAPPSAPTRSPPAAVCWRPAAKKLGGARVVEGTVGVGWAGLGRGYPAWRRTSPRRAAGAEVLHFQPQGTSASSRSPQQQLTRRSASKCSHTMAGATSANNTAKRRPRGESMSSSNRGRRIRMGFKGSLSSLAIAPRWHVPRAARMSRSG
jgi:hypothetical protein